MEWVGRYAIRGPLGSGGFGTVYLGTDPDTGGPVAVKVLDHPGDDWRRDLLRAEAAALLQVNDPHCVRIRDVVDTADVAAIVTDYVEGVTLRSLLRDAGRLDGPQSLGVLRGALTGLAAVHTAGLIHADLKPENILVDRTGTSRLIDFGLTAPPRMLDGPNTWYGTPSYLSPERVLGQFVDIRSDIYAAAVILFELSCGQVPFRGANPVETAELHVRAPIPDPRVLTPEVGEGVAALCLQNLDKDPGRRHQSAAALLVSLELVAAERYGTDWLRAAGLSGVVGALLGSTPAWFGLLGAGAAGGTTAAAALGAAGAAGASGVAGLAGAGIGVAGGGVAGGGGAAAGGAAAGGAGVGGGAAAAGSGAAAGGSSAAVGTATSTAGALGGTKAALAVGATILVAAGGGAGVAALIVDEPDPRAAPSTAFEPAVLAAYTTQTPRGVLTAQVLGTNGTSVPIRQIQQPRTGARPPYDLQLASSADGRYVAAIDGAHLTVVSGADPTNQQTIDCACLGIAFAEDGSLVALTVDNVFDTYTVSDDDLDLTSSVAITEAPATDPGDPTRHYATELLGVDGGTAYAVLPGRLENEYVESVVTTVDLKSGRASELLDLDIAYVHDSGFSAEHRYLALATGPGDGCSYSDLWVLDLDAAPGSASSVAKIAGPDGIADASAPGNVLESMRWDGDDLVANWITGDICAGGDEPARAYRTALGPLLAPDAPTQAWEWRPDSDQLGVSWQATAYDGRSLSSWRSADYGQELWLGDPETDGTKVAGSVASVVPVGPPGKAVGHPPPSGTEEIEVDPWFADGSLKPGYVVEDDGNGGYAIDCSYDSGSPVAVVPATHWCGSTADYTYACWNDPSSTQHMLCLSSPWSRTIRRVQVQNLDPDTPVPADPAPFGVELRDGSECFFRIGGAWGATPPDTLAIYGCSDADPVNEDWILLVKADEDVFRVDREGTWSVLAYHPGDAYDPQAQEDPQWLEVERVYWMAGGP